MGCPILLAVFWREDGRRYNHVTEAHRNFPPTPSPKASERMRHPARNGNAVESVLLGGSPRIYVGEGALQRSGRSSTSICALAPGWRARSEEHTSELQSLRHLVC